VLRRPLELKPSRWANSNRQNHWADRYRISGPAAMTDRSSRPHHSPNQTSARTERRIIKVRVLRRWGPVRIAYLLGLNPAPSTAS
jgi:hypothetical protein